MGQIFNPDDNGRPYMYTRIWPDGWLGFSPWHGASQVSGRHLDALLAQDGDPRTRGIHERRGHVVAQVERGLGGQARIGVVE